MKDVCNDTEFWCNQFGNEYLFKSEKESDNMHLTKTTIRTIKELWNKMEVPQRAEWCKEAGLGGQKGSVDVGQMDFDMLEALSQVAIISNNSEGTMTNNSKKETEKVTKEATIETQEPVAQEVTLEANKDIIKGKEKKGKEKKTRAKRQADLGEAMAEKKPVTKKSKAEKSEIDKKEKKVKTEVVVKPGNVAKEWYNATNRARINMCGSVGVRKNQFRIPYGDLRKEDKEKILAGDTSILSVRGKAGKNKRETSSPKSTKPEKIDKNAKLTDIQLKNLKDVGDGKAFLAKGVGNNGRNYIVFVAERK